MIEKIIRTMSGDDELRAYNEKLIQRYPLLLPNGAGELYDYDLSYTMLDEMPDAYRAAFGDFMLEDIRNVLIANHYLEEYSVFQIKSKYGSLRWYDNGAPDGVQNVISDYEFISQSICCICGKPDVPIIADGWIDPFCRECWHAMDENRKYAYHTDERYDKCASKEYVIPDIRHVTVFDVSGTHIKSINIADKVARIRKRWADKGDKPLAIFWEIPHD